MSVEVLYLLRKDEVAGLRELDDVVVLDEVLSMDGAAIPPGTEGTVVGVLREGEDYAIEFAEPEGALAAVKAAALRRVGRSAP